MTSRSRISKNSIKTVNDFRNLNLKQQTRIMNLQQTASETNMAISSDYSKKNGGKIHLIIGPMFSGKSTELLRLVRRYNFKRKTTAVVAFELDSRYSNTEKVVTHDMYEYPAIKTGKISDIKERLMNYDVIGIDEGQFYPDLCEEVEELANMGKIVIISALSGNFKREPFEVIAKIIPKCETIQNVTAICFNCNDEANFTLRITKDQEEVVIGGDDMYKPSCRSCFMSYNNKISKTPSEKSLKTERQAQPQPQEDKDNKEDKETCLENKENLLIHS